MREVWLLDPPAVVVAGINMGSGAVVHHTGMAHRTNSQENSQESFWPAQ